ncbi:hypothetical protein M422DRAFT_252855 [Sphaerobolus stellatus SS14]|uniref:Uncharacterized protein n=1 Tax=Sphaerobolus stellatus (strain SS14) TaxID=990650 RepID=A0A0C9VAG3_SPHS4|nr:hypothetical protein M422DRAFT_252855 [Sphaerobolus stellatus SS14]
MDVNLEVISSLQWSLSALANIDRQNIGLRTLDNQLLSDTSVPEELQDAVEHGHAHVIECYNSTAQMCSAQMKSISSRYGLGKNFGGRVPMLNCYGGLDLTREVESGIKKRKAEEAATKPSSSKRIRKDKELESGVKEVEKEVEKEVGPDPAPAVDKGKGKEKELGPEENGEDTMKE